MLKKLFLNIFIMLFLSLNVLVSTDYRPELTLMDLKKAFKFDDCEIQLIFVNDYPVSFTRLIDTNKKMVVTVKSHKILMKLHSDKISFVKLCDLSDTIKKEILESKIDDFYVGFFKDTPLDTNINKSTLKLRPDKIDFKPKDNGNK